MSSDAVDVDDVEDDDVEFVSVSSFFLSLYRAL